MFQKPSIRLRMNRRLFLGTGGAAILTGIPAIRLRAQQTGVLRFSLSSYPSSLAPFQHSGTAAGAVKLAIHRGLMSYDSEGNLRNELLDSWSAEDDRTFLMKMREGVTFHNGDPVTSEAAKFMFDQITAEGSTAALIGAYRQIETIEIVDDVNFRLRLVAPSATFLYNLANFNSPVISPKSTEDDIIGCGPYQIVEMERGSHIICEAYEGYYKPGLPMTRSLEFHARPDDASRVAALETGDTDLIEFVPWQSMSGIEANSALRLDTVDGPSMGITFNLMQGPFQDVRLRQAVAFAVDRNAIAQAAFFGRATPIEGLPVPDNSFAHDRERQTYWAQDVERARALVSAAGAEGLSTTLLATSQYGMHRSTAEVVQQSLNAIGLNVELALPDYATRIQLGNRGQYEFSISGYTPAFNDPDALSVLIESTDGISYVRSAGYKNEEVDRLLREGRGMQDVEERKPVYARIIDLALEDAPFIGLCWRKEGYAMRAGVDGFHNLPGPATIFSPITLEDTTV